MRKTLLLFLTVILSSIAILSCGGDSENEVALNDCGTITGFDAVQDAGKINVTIASSGALYYEVSFAYADNSDTSAESGIIKSLQSTSESVEIKNFILSGNYLVYVRAVCNENKKSKWFGPKTITVNDYCATPTELAVYGANFSWNYSDYETEVSNYQIEYGPQGFTSGSGTKATVNSMSYTGAAMQAGQSYDFYVRAYCSNNLGYGSWAGPFTYFAEHDIQMCTAPSGLVWNVERNFFGEAVGATFDWNANGESKFEITRVYRNHDISEGQINTVTGSTVTLLSIPQNTNYDFYVRAVCVDGNRTAWVKVQFNIGT